MIDFEVEARGVLRRYWMRLLGPGFVLDVRCLRVLEGRHVMAVHADEYAQVGRLAEACGRLRRPHRG